MTTAQRGMLLALIDEYASAQPKAQAAERVAKLKKAGLDGVKFGWMGGIEKGALHYYRVQGPTFLIEYDCVQNEAQPHPRRVARLRRRLRRRPAGAALQEVGAPPRAAVGRNCSK